MLLYFRSKTQVEEGNNSFQVTSLVSYSKGFACAFGLGTVYLFEKTDDKDFFKKAREIMVCAYVMFSLFYETNRLIHLL